MDFKLIAILIQRDYNMPSKIKNIFNNINKFFESYKSFFGFLELVVLALTLYFAIQIGNRQNDINQSLLDLNYLPAVNVFISDDRHQLITENRGQSNIWLWGNKYDGVISMEDEPKIITQLSYYYIPTQKLENSLKEEIGANGKIDKDYYTFLTTSNEKPYVIKTIFKFEIEDNVISTRSQTVGIFQSEFENFIISIKEQ